jgi:hypothetical protein
MFGWKKIFSGLVIFLVAAPAVRAAPICMSKSMPPRTGMNNPPESSIFVSSRDLTKFEAKGFARVECGAGVNQLRQDRDDVCRLAAANAPSLNRAFEEQFGATPAELCASADDVVKQEEGQ